MRSPSAAFLALVALALAGCGQAARPLAGTAPAQAMAAAGRKASPIDTPAARALFKRLDASQDRRLGLAEYEALGIFGVRAVAPGPGTKPTIAGLQKLTFGYLDLDHDGALTAAEFVESGFAELGVVNTIRAIGTSSGAHFATLLDNEIAGDGDGRVSLAEYRQLGIFGVHGVGHRQVVVDGDGPAAAAPAPDLAALQEATFRLHDADRDGKLDATELETVVAFLRLIP